MKKKIALFLCLVFVLSMVLPIERPLIVHAQEEPVVYFGHYFQNVVNDNYLYNALFYEAEFDKNNIAKIGGKKYTRRDYKFYSNDPIEWIVLDSEADYYVLMSKKILFRRSLAQFWNESNLREYLNNDFYNFAFSAKERKSILTSTNTTLYWPYNDRYLDGRNAQYVTTKDKVYILSAEDAKNGAYGFSALEEADSKRVAETTAWVRDDQKPEWWMCRGPEDWCYGTLRDTVVGYNGEIIHCGMRDTGSFGIRPVIKVKKNAVSFTKEDNGYKTNKSVSGKYKDGQTEKILKDTERFRDDYFFKNSSKVQGDLAKMSLLAASSVYHESFAENLMKQCEFEYVLYDTNDPTKYKNDTVAFCIGVKRVDNTYIVAIWIKGTSGNYEWVSNFNMGTGKTHTGFSLAEKDM